MPFFTPIGIKRNRWNETNLCCRGHEKRSWTQTWRRSHTWQTTIKTKWALWSDYVFSETRVIYNIWCILSRYSKFSKIKNANMMMNINDKLVASLKLWTRTSWIYILVVIYSGRNINTIILLAIFEYCLYDKDWYMSKYLIRKILTLIWSKVLMKNYFRSKDLPEKKKKRMIENSTSQVIKYNNHVELQQSRVRASLENCAMSTPNNHHLKLNLCLD